MSTSNKVCKDGALKLSSSDDVCEEVNNMLQNMSAADKDASVCANCGKEGSDVTNTCNKCKQVKYCNAVCKKKHRHKHKKECEEHCRLATELHDKELFRPPPSLYGDCPICFQLLPTLDSGRRYMPCCGKVICSGCCYAPVYDNQGNKVDNRKCAFCRTSWPDSDVEDVQRLEKRVGVGDAEAIHCMGCDYRDGSRGCEKDHTKALELFYQAAEFGYAFAYNSIGYAYEYGRSVEVDKEKANHYYELAAMQGDSTARCNLGEMEEKAGNIDRALKHYMIAVKDDDDSLKQIQILYTNGHASKEDYTKALQLYQEYLGEIKSKQRDEAAAADEDYRYY